MSDYPTDIYEKPRSLGGPVDWTDTARTGDGSAVAVEKLATDLRRHVRGEVRFERASRSLYSTDSSNYRLIPVGVVVPVDVDDMVAAVAACRRHNAPVLHRGGGTSLGGQTTNAAVIIDSSKYVNRVLEIDPEGRTARVQPGVTLDQLNAVTRKHGLLYGPDPSTHEYCTFGGMIGNNACGVHSELAGRTVENVVELEILTYDGARMRLGRTSDDELARIAALGGRRGEIYKKLVGLRERYADFIRERYPEIPRRVSGYNLDELLPEKGFNVAGSLVGSEGTCVTVLEAVVRLVPDPAHKVLVVLGFRNVVEAGHHVAEVKEFGPMALEGMDAVLYDNMRLKHIHDEARELLPEGGGWLFVELGADTKEESESKIRRLVEHLRQAADPPTVKVVRDPDEQQQLWEVRESGLGATARVPEQRDTWPGWEDSAVPPEKIGHYLKDLQTLYEKHNYQGALYGHFGQGCVHTRISFDLRSSPGIEEYRRFIDEASDACLRYGGSFTAEHGDGQARSELLPKMYGKELVEAFREFKTIWDPEWKMNPGIIVDPYRMDEHLRLGASYDPPKLETTFQFPDDAHDFSRAVLRCVGVGKCRRTDMGPDAVMCPSYVATREEMHTTRGRARLLFEMLNGDESPGPWNDEGVKESLDLCLSCKGCKNDCPVNVDMATYKSEFLSHYYQENRRPRHAYAFGLIYWWARMASKSPVLANFFSQTRGLDRAAKWAAGVAPQRRIPKFAAQTFRQWFSERGGTLNPNGSPRVLLWPDTFNNYFKPETAKAAVAVLESAGCQVVLPPRPLCCGRPLYEYGMLKPVVRLWKQTLDTLRDEIRAGTPVVGLEPSCVAAFRDELVNLFPNDWDAKRLSRQTYMFSTFVQEHMDSYQPPTFYGTALLHGHCHHKSVLGFDAEKQLFDAMGVDYQVPPASCCGMAGAFGYEAEHYDVSLAVGEHALLPAVRSASKETFVIADGFSCREQIEQTTDRRAMHSAEMLYMAAHQPKDTGEPYPERRFLKLAEESPRSGWKPIAVAAAAFAVSAVVVWIASR